MSDSPIRRWLSVLLGVVIVQATVAAIYAAGYGLYRLGVIE